MAVFSDSLILTIIGPDRPGLVADLSLALKECGGNWVESRLIRLGGQFAGVVRMSVAAEQRESLLQRLAKLEQEGYQLTYQEGEKGSDAETGQTVVSLEVMGADHPGIVEAITSTLAAHRINIAEITTGIVSAPMSGEPLFQAKADLLLPPSCDLQALRGELESIAADLMVDLNFAR